MDAGTCHTTEAPRQARLAACHAGLALPAQHTPRPSPHGHVRQHTQHGATNTTLGQQASAAGTTDTTCTTGTTCNTGNTPSSCPRQQAQHHPQRRWQRSRDTCRPASSDPEARPPRRRQAAHSATHRHVSRHRYYLRCEMLPYLRSFLTCSSRQMLFSSLQILLSSRLLSRSPFVLHPSPSTVGARGSRGGDRSTTCTLQRPHHKTPRPHPHVRARARMHQRTTPSVRAA